MNPSNFIPILLLFLILWLDKQRKLYLTKKFVKNKLKKDGDNMIDLAKRFVDKECLIYTFNSNQIEGIIREVGNSAVLVDSKGTLEVINLDFIVRIREYPKNKKGQKKSVVLD